MCGIILVDGLFLVVCLVRRLTIFLYVLTCLLPILLNGIISFDYCSYSAYSCFF